jgi:serine/threonine protein kinase
MAVRYDMQLMHARLHGYNYHFYLNKYRADRRRTKEAAEEKFAGVTPYYASPETSYIDLFFKASDVWSFGLIVVEVYVSKAA